jgi:CrcB protein
MAVPPASLASSLAAIAIGAVLGAWLRWGLALWLNERWPRIPLGTLAANLLGGLIAGIALAWLSRHPELSPQWRLFLVTGFLGALTTFSSFSLESLELLQRGLVGWALAHSVLHLVGALAATALGWRLAS